MKATTIPLNKAVLLLFASAFSLSLGGASRSRKNPKNVWMKPAISSL